MFDLVGFVWSEFPIEGGGHITMAVIPLPFEVRPLLLIPPPLEICGLESGLQLPTSFNILAKLQKCL